MSFRFSLQKILDLREQETKNAESNVAEMHGIILQLKQILEKERDFYFQDRDNLNLSVKNVEFSQIKIFEQSLAIRQEKMMNILKNIRDAQFDLKDKELILIQAKKNQKMIEKLYKIKEQEYLKKENQKEQRLLDEIANNNFIKNRLEMESNNEDE
jgi:flagellar FliJ protein